MNEKTTIKDPATGTYTKVYTHQRVRAAYQSLLSLHRRDLLFTYLPITLLGVPRREPKVHNRIPGIGAGYVGFRSLRMNGTRRWPWHGS